MKYKDIEVKFGPGDIVEVLHGPRTPERSYIEPDDIGTLGIIQENREGNLGIYCIMDTEKKCYDSFYQQHLRHTKKYLMIQHII